MIEKIKQTTKDLIKIPSDKNNSKAIHETIEYVKKFFKNSDFSIEEYKWEDKPSLVIKNFEGKNADICLCGHMDVVPANTEDQRKPYEKDGKLYGRGSGDMKIGNSIMIHLMKNLENEGYNEKKIMLMFSSDEEIGGFNGVNKLLNESGFSSKITIIPDGGGPEKIVYASKGVLHLEVITKGKDAHGSRRREGENAIDKIFSFYQELREKIEKKYMLNEENEYRSTTINLTNIHSGKGSINIIPEKAESKIDIRFTEERTTDTLFQYIQKIAKKYGGIYLKIKSKGAILHTPPKNEILQKYLKTAKERISDNVKLTKEHGATDGKYFSEKGGVVIIHQPEVKNIHKEGEYSVINSYMKIYNTYKQFIKEINL